MNKYIALLQHGADINSAISQIEVCGGEDVVASPDGLSVRFTAEPYIVLAVGEMSAIESVAEDKAVAA